MKKNCFSGLEGNPCAELQNEFHFLQISLSLAFSWFKTKNTETSIIQLLLSLLLLSLLLLFLSLISSRLQSQSNNHHCSLCIQTDRPSSPLFPHYLVVGRNTLLLYTSLFFFPPFFSLSFHHQVLSLFMTKVIIPFTVIKASSLLCNIFYSTTRLNRSSF